MRNLKLTIFIILSTLLVGCKRKYQKDIFFSSRDATLGGVSLSINGDYNFVYTLYGLWDKTECYGMLRIDNDTLSLTLNSDNEIDCSKLGEKAYINGDKLYFYDSNDFMEIHKNKLFDKSE